MKTFPWAAPGSYWIETCVHQRRAQFTFLQLVQKYKSTILILLLLNIVNQFLFSQQVNCVDQEWQKSTIPCIGQKRVSAI